MQPQQEFDMARVAGTTAGPSVIERCWIEKARNGRFWVVNRYGRITRCTVSRRDAEAILAFINGWY